MTQFDPSPLINIVRSLFPPGGRDIAQIALLGDPSIIRQLRLAEEFYTEAAVYPSRFNSGESLFSANTPKYDLIVIVDDPASALPVSALHITEGTDLVAPDILLVFAPKGNSAPTPAERWIEWLGHLAGLGYAPDFVKEALFAQLPVLHLRHTDTDSAHIAAHMGLAAYHYWQQWLIAQQTARQQDFLLTSVVQDAQNHQIYAERLGNRLAVLEEQAHLLGGDWERLQATPGYAVMLTLQRMRARIAPQGSKRERLLEMILGWSHISHTHGITGLVRHLQGEVRWRSQVWLSRFDSRKDYANRLVSVTPPLQRPPLTIHTESVDIIICIHNALDEVQECLASIQKHTFEPYRLVLIDDGSDPLTRDFLRDFANRTPPTVLLRAEDATGYTKAANRGLRFGSADFLLLLNSDTVVTEQWLERMMACAASDKTIGMVGPLSNTASWQSVPNILHGNDWAENPIPPELGIDGWARLIARHAARIYPQMPFLNGFCLLLRRQLLDAIGYFDEAAFGAGYGEENDYALRARAAGWKLALADDAYVYHAQSRSYSHERRRQLSAKAHTALLAKHNPAHIETGVDYCRNNWVLGGIRARADLLAEREALLQNGRRAFAGQRILFVLPINHPGGGGNVVISEGLAMRRMGVDVQLFNLASFREGFERGYPDLALPVRYGDPTDLSQHLGDFDAVIATWCGSVHWIADALASSDATPRQGYYVQDYEPYFFPPDSELFQMAERSYTALPKMRLFTKTEWNRQEVLTKTGADCAVIGPSIDIDSFLPLPAGEEAPDRPLRITALVRPNSYRRAPELTMRLLRRLSHRYASRVEITLFGVDLSDPNFAPLPKDFDWRLAGVIDPARVGALIARTDIFTDFSEYQAMGLTALEAMACGAAVIVPRKGGADSYAQHGESAWIVDTASEEACWEGLCHLVENRDVRHRLRRGAIRRACDFPLERAALNILTRLFESPDLSAPVSGEA